MFVDPILNPLLTLPPFWAIVIVSLVIAVLMTLVYKWMTDQHLMKSLKDEIKEHQNKMKEHKNDPQKMMEIQKQAMEVNMKYMMQSLKPTFVTFIPIILIFGWLNTNLAYMPIQPEQEFRVAAIFDAGSGEMTLGPYEGITFLNGETQEIVENKAVWRLKADKGEYLLKFTYNDRIIEKELIVTDEQRYAPITESFKDIEIKVNNEPMKLLNILGWKIGWLGTYIIFSIIFSMSLRKAMKLH